MTTFIAACVGLILVSGLFYLFPFRRGQDSDQDLTQANLAWYRLREEELAAEGDEALREDARLRLLEEESQQQPSTSADQAGQSFPSWILMPFVAVLSVALYFNLGAAQDVLIVQQLTNMGDSASPEAIDRLIADIEVRSAQRPDNLHYVGLLGRFYMGQQDYSRASEVYADLARAVPEDAQALAYAAQAEYLAAGRTLSPRARLRAEQALAANPHQRTALGLLGMASFEQKQYRVAIEYWQRLLAMEAPGSDSAEMINSVIASAQLALGESPDGAAPSPVAEPAPPVVAGAGVTIRVVVPENAVISPSDTVFVLARNAASDSRMPIAVQRLTGAQLPITLRLDDSNSMAGQKISAIDSVIVAVQVSPEGRPGEAGASWLGQAGPLTPSLDSASVDVELQPNPR